MMKMLQDLSVDGTGGWIIDDLKKAVNAPERLIDGNELMEWLKNKIRECVILNAHAEAATTEEIIRYVKAMPAVDAVSVVHGRWVDEDYPYKDANVNPRVTAICSNCGNIAHHMEHGYSILSKYCPNCGAKMDGKQE